MENHHIFSNRQTIVDKFSCDAFQPSFSFFSFKIKIRRQQFFILILFFSLWKLDTVGWLQWKTEHSVFSPILRYIHSFIQETLTQDATTCTITGQQLVSYNLCQLALCISQLVTNLIQLEVQSSFNSSSGSVVSS